MQNKLQYIPLEPWKLQTEEVGLRSYESVQSRNCFSLIKELIEEKGKKHPIVHLHTCNQTSKSYRIDFLKKNKESVKSNRTYVDNNYSIEYTEKYAPIVTYNTSIHSEIKPMISPNYIEYNGKFSFRSTHPRNQRKLKRTKKGERIREYNNKSTTLETNQSGMRSPNGSYHFGRMLRIKSKTQPKICYPFDEQENENKLEKLKINSKTLKIETQTNCESPTGFRVTKKIRYDQWKECYRPRKEETDAKIEHPLAIVGGKIYI